MDQISKEELKKHCCDFFRWWWNKEGTNTEQGFEEWYKENFQQEPSKPTLEEWEKIKRVNQNVCSYHYLQFLDPKCSDYDHEINNVFHHAFEEELGEGERKKFPFDLKYKIETEDKRIFTTYYWVCKKSGKEIKQYEEDTV